MVCVSQAFHEGWYGTAIFYSSVPLDRASSSKSHAESLDFCLGLLFLSPLLSFLVGLLTPLCVGLSISYVCV